MFVFSVFSFSVSDIAGILGHTDTKVISDTNLAGLVRQIAIHCNVSYIITISSDILGSLLLWHDILWLSVNC